MLNLFLKLKYVYNWLRQWLSETDIKQASLYILMTVLLLYIASKLTGWLAVIAAAGAIAYGVYEIWTIYGKTIIEKLLNQNKNEEEI